MKLVCVFLFMLQNVNCDLFEELIKNTGYSYETHSDIVTKDGYYLTVHRVPYGKDGPTLKKRHPVLLMHGILSSSDNFLVMGPEKSLGYILADKGYDVWIGNIRSVSHSRRHVSLDPDKDNEFWKFSYTELGVYDLPAIVDYILDITSYEDLYYIGHSQGTILCMIMCSELPEYNNKIRTLFALSPSAYIHNHDHPWIYYALNYFKFAHEYFGLHEITCGRDIIRVIAPFSCKLPVINYMCQLGIMLVAGFNSKQLNKEHIPAIVMNAPEGTGIYQLLHYYQISQTGKFTKYDWGEEENLKRYGSAEPPEYNLEKVVAPTALYYSKADWFVRPENVHKLSKELANVIDIHQVEDEHFSHLDFTTANFAVDLIYNRIVETMDERKKEDVCSNKKCKET